MIKFIDNIGEYFASNYFDEDFRKKVFDKSGYSQDDLKEISKNISSLKDKYFKYKNKFLEQKRTKDRILTTHEFHSDLLKSLEYDGSRPEYNELFPLNSKHVIPVRHRLFHGDKPHLFIMEMQGMVQEGEITPKGLFEQRYIDDEEEVNGKPQTYNRSQWDKVFQVPDGLTISPSIINEAISELFLLPQNERPSYILLLAGSELYLLQYEKWFKGSYLRFTLENLFDEAAVIREYYTLFYLLCGKKFLSPDADIVLMEQLDEDSHKSAYAVTQDLKEGIIHAVEEIANEAVYYINKTEKEIDISDPGFAGKTKDDALTLIYRLLFVFYAESRPDLEILPVNDRVYENGYSLEMLRDLELVPLNSQSTRDGYFFHESLSKLFNLLNKGYRIDEIDNRSFQVIKLDTPLFDNSKLNYLDNVKFRNIVWQRIISELSLSQKKKGKARGRISYANLGINQLGSVYEGLLAYRGFYADQDYIEVKNADDPNGNDGTFVVERIRRDDFEEKEILKDSDNETMDKIIPKGHFIYRLSGRDRQKSASYYTPEVLTRTTVKYTLKPIIERLGNGDIKALDLLDLKIMEPAMGAAAFHNETINQIAEAYIEYRQKERKEKVSPGRYQEEVQKVKSYIAINNVYGVDINPTAIELGKLSLWLNVIHKSMETPFFGYRLGLGNAVVGAWLKTYNKKDIILEYTDYKRKNSEKKEWWEKIPKDLKFNKDGRINRKDDEIYHFLLPDKSMAPSAGIKLLKDEFPEEAKRVNKWRTDFCQPIKGDEFLTLQAICAKIDALLYQHYQFNRIVNSYTRDKELIWGREPEQLTTHSYSEKEQIHNQRYKNASPYFKIKTIMDYWCSLWFWNMRDAVDLPTREQYLKDISLILELDLEKEVLNTSTQWEIDRAAEQKNLFRNPEKQLTLQEYRTDFERKITIDAIQKYTNRSELFENKRIELVRKYADNNLFFHYQIEFIEVFIERGGFDVIVGNPPWVKLTFEERDIIGENNPEVFIKNLAAPDIKVYLNKELSNSSFKSMFCDALVSAENSSEFVNSKSLYPLLIGQQKNLYKAILEVTFSLCSLNGYIGLLHPETIYDDPSGDVFREELYQKLIYHFQFLNELLLFAEVGHRMLYSINIYKGKKTEINFISINNLFHPSTIESSFIHDGKGVFGGFKIKDSSQDKFVWNIKPHKDRIINISENELKIFSELFESSKKHTSAKLVSIQSKKIINVLEKIAKFPKKLIDFESIITEGWHETNDVNNKTIRRQTKYPEIDNYEMIYSGPHFHVANPLSKTPRSICTEKAHYDIIDLELIEDQYISRTNYIPVIPLDQFKSLIIGFETDLKNITTIDPWIEYYKLGFSKMLNTSSERTLQPAILPRKSSHINGVISVTFKDIDPLVEFSALASSIIFDFLIKTIGTANLTNSRLTSLPLGIDFKYKNSLFCRLLLLNCLSRDYEELWKKAFNKEFKKQEWSIRDGRLSDFSRLDSKWDWNTPIRNSFARRWTLIEIDVISALIFNLNLNELISIYEIAFPLMQQYEDDTWYDKKGKIVFTNNKALNGVGFDRAEWEKVKGNKEGQMVRHTITKSELYSGKEVTYYPPFERCDRVRDYKIAWTHFEKVFKKK